MGFYIVMLVQKTLFHRILSSPGCRVDSGADGAQLAADVGGDHQDGRPGIDVDMMHIPLCVGFYAHVDIVYVCMLICNLHIIYIYNISIYICMHIL